MRSMEAKRVPDGQKVVAATFAAYRDGYINY
jgi:hypothetical protein